MAIPFLSVNLRTPACDFEPVMLAPGLPMLDLPAGQASCRILRKWLGDLIAEPCWTSTGVLYFLPLEDSTTAAGLRAQCITPQDLRSGPIRAQYLKLWTLLSRVQPEAGEAALLSAVCKSFESPDQAARMGQLGDCLFKYRDAQKCWRLVWAWGYRRKAERLGPASLCRQCSLLSVRNRATLGCPACGFRARPRLLPALALASLLIGLGWGLWAFSRPRTAGQDLAGHPAAPAASARVVPVQRAPHTALSIPAPLAAHTRDADATIAKITKPVQPVIATPRQKLVRTTVVVHSAAPPRPAPDKVPPVAIASAAIPSSASATPRRPAEVVTPSASGQLPHGVTVDQDGKVFLGYRPVAPTFEATTQFSPGGKQPSRYIFGSHVVAQSHDELHGGDSALQQWQHYVMSDEQENRPAGTDADHTVSLVLLDRGTDAEITNATGAGDDSWFDNGSDVHLVETAASRNTAPYSTSHPAFRLPPIPSMMAPMPSFYATTPHCHGKHHRNGYGPALQRPPVTFRRFMPSSREPPLDAKLTVVALQYFGHSSPDEVLADLETARAKAEAQATMQHSSDAHRAILQLCDSEIALWRNVVSSRSTADAATAAYKAGDMRRAGELCQQYQSLVAAYTDRPEWSLFDTQSQQVAALRDKLNTEPAASH